MAPKRGTNPLKISLKVMTRLAFPIKIQRINKPQAIIVSGKTQVKG